jgi:hypothetical protein
MDAAGFLSDGGHELSDHGFNGLRMDGGVPRGIDGLQWGLGNDGSDASLTHLFAGMAAQPAEGGVHGHFADFSGTGGVEGLGAVASMHHASVRMSEPWALPGAGGGMAAHSAALPQFFLDNGMGGAGFDGGGVFDALDDGLGDDDGELAMPLGEP